MCKAAHFLSHLLGTFGFVEAHHVLSVSEASPFHGLCEQGA